MQKSDLSDLLGDVETTLQEDPRYAVEILLSRSEALELAVWAQMENDEEYIWLAPMKHGSIAQMKSFYQNYALRVANLKSFRVEDNYLTWHKEGEKRWDKFLPWINPLHRFRAPIDSVTGFYVYLPEVPVKLHTV